jgi:hypothetical protein
MKSFLLPAAHLPFPESCSPPVFKLTEKSNNKATPSCKQEIGKRKNSFL